eukprot:Colp12_sorted_trinity150504_noHs@36110
MKSFSLAACGLALLSASMAEAQKTAKSHYAGSYAHHEPTALDWKGNLGNILMFAVLTLVVYFIVGPALQSVKKPKTEEELAKAKEARREQKRLKKSLGAFGFVMDVHPLVLCFATFAIMAVLFAPDFEEEVAHLGFSSLFGGASNSQAAAPVQKQQEYVKPKPQPVPRQASSNYHLPMNVEMNGLLGNVLILCTSALLVYWIVRPNSWGLDKSSRKKNKNLGFVMFLVVCSIACGILMALPPDSAASIFGSSSSGQAPSAPVYQHQQARPPVNPAKAKARTARSASKNVLGHFINLSGPLFPQHAGLATSIGIIVAMSVVVWWIVQPAIKSSKRVAKRRD